MRDDEFNAAFVESMNETIRSLLSEEVLDAFRSNLKNKRAINPEEIPDNLPIVSIVLKKYFGASASTIETAIARKLYAKYGLEFQKNQGHQLADYVESARSKLKPPAPEIEPTIENLPLKEDFDKLLVESVREGIEDALGKDSAKLAFRFLEHDVAFDKLPQHLPVFYAALNKNFGKDHGKIELAIARKLYQKLSLEFIESPDMGLGRYVEMALAKLTQREQLGFMSTVSRLEKPR